MRNQPAKKSLLDAYQVPGVKAVARIEECKEGSSAFVITLTPYRRSHRLQKVVFEIARDLASAGDLPGVSVFP